MSQFAVSSSPHIRSELTTKRIMLDVVIALLPAAVAGTVIFGYRALIVLITCVCTALLSEYLFNLVTKSEVTITDFSAVVTGLLLGLNLRADVPIWQAVLGTVFAIVVVKCLFGGLGCNFANPAIAARVFLLVSFAGTVGGGAVPIVGEELELVSGATPLSVIKNGGALPSLKTLFLGTYGGAIGETCTLALLIGFIYLVIRRVINPLVPAVYIGTVFVLFLISDSSYISALYQVLCGGLVLGAVFMATDYVTSPITLSGKLIFAFGCGLITFLIRAFGNYPEGVSFAILFMNILTPFIEKWTKSVPLGGRVK